MIKASNLLGSGNNPYVHSRYENFLANKSAVSRTLQKRTDNTKIVNKLNNLKTIRDQLKDSVKNFLGNAQMEDAYTIEEFLKIMGQELGYDLKFGLLFKEFLQSTDFYNYAASEIGKERQRRMKEMAPDFTSEIQNMDPMKLAGISHSEAGKIILELMLGNQKSISKEKFLEKLQGVPDNIKIDLPKRLTKNIKKDTMGKFISKINQKFNDQRQKGTAEVSFKTVIERFCGASGSKFKVYLKQNGYSVDELNFKNSYEILEARIKKTLENIYIGVNKTKIGETRGEELFKAIFSTEGENGFQIEVLGADLQEKAGEFAKELRGKVENEIELERHTSIKSDKKMASFDLLIKNNQLKNNKNAVIGVQSKNYNDFYDALIDSGKTQQFVKIFNTTKNTKTIGGFVDLLDEKGFVVDKSSLVYTLANMIWFSSGGAIVGEGEVSARQIEVSDMGTLIEELNVVIANLLGVEFYKQFEIIPHQSNGFWLLNNRYLIPTWVIIDKLIEIAERKYDEMFVNSDLPISLSVSGFSNYKTSLQEVENFYIHKISAKSSENISKNVLAIGAAKGSEIAHSTINMKSIGLTFDLKSDLLSSFRI